jgi:peptide methionine sulfoxide reductase msrA/msrB
MTFIPLAKAPVERAVFAGGCFWGLEYYFAQQEGVLAVTAGYTGGYKVRPTYKQVCTGKTGHAEAVEVIYEPNTVTYEQLARLFFEIHDFTQLNRQGPDIGTQYRSAVFVLNDDQKKITEQLIEQLKQKGFSVKTSVVKLKRFWSAELYHQDYYQKTAKQPYCHKRRLVFKQDSDKDTKVK